MISAKDGRVESPTVLAWMRRQICRACHEQHLREGTPAPRPGSDPHHVEGKGMGGARCRDDRVVPLCRLHHDQAHELGKDEGALLDYWAIEALARFLDEAGPDEVRSYLADLERWKNRPMMVEF